MNRHAIEAAIPYNVEGDPLSQEIAFDDDLRILLPGKYNRLMRGGDFMVQLKIDGEWLPASGSRLIQEVELMCIEDGEWCRNKLGPALVMLDKGRIGLDEIDMIPGGPWVSMSPRHLLRTVMLLAVHERRKTGDDSNLIKLMLGVIYGNWEAKHAIKAYKSGVKGIRALRAAAGREPHYSDIIGVRV